MKRRTFLGGTIGLFAAGSRPFVAHALGRPMPALEDPEGLIRLFDMPFDEIADLLVALELQIGGDREWVLGRMGAYERDACSVTVRHADFVPLEVTIVHGIALLTRNHAVISRKRFHAGAQTTNPGDTLKASYTVTRPMIFIDDRHVPGRPA